MFTIGRIAYRREGVFFPLKCIIGLEMGMGVDSVGEVCYLRLPCYSCCSLGFLEASDVTPSPLSSSDDLRPKLLASRAPECHRPAAINML